MLNNGKVAEWSKAHGSGISESLNSTSVDFRVSQGAWVRIPPLSVLFLLFLIPLWVLAALPRLRLLAHPALDAILTPRSTHCAFVTVIFALHTINPTNLCGFVLFLTSERTSFYRRTINSLEFALISLLIL